VKSIFKEKGFSSYHDNSNGSESKGKETQSSRFQQSFVYLYYVVQKKQAE
jgi:hypothetical protein